MRTRLKALLPALSTLLLLAAPAQAETLSCPDLADAVQVAACPTEDELRYTFMGFCGDNARLYGRDVFTCASFENYREAKNIALWESADGAFSGYLSCNVGADAIRKARPLRMSREQGKGLTRLLCDYENDHRLVHRTKADCTVQTAEGGGSARCE